MNKYIDILFNKFLKSKPQTTLNLNITCFCNKEYILSCSQDIVLSPCNCFSYRFHKSMVIGFYKNNFTFYYEIHSNNIVINQKRNPFLPTINKPIRFNFNPPINLNQILCKYHNIINLS